MPPTITAERLAQGRTFEEYLAYLASPENLGREGNEGARREDLSGAVRASYEGFALTEHQRAAMAWLAAQPGGSSKVLVIAEEWSSDCRRDVPVAQRLAEAGGLELRIFNRDGDRYSGSASPELDASPSPDADLFIPFLNRKPGGPYQSIPVVAFFTSAFEYLYHYTEFPALYWKDALRERMAVPLPGESSEETRARANDEFLALRQSPFFRVWASAAADEMISGLHRRLILGGG